MATTDWRGVLNKYIKSTCIQVEEGLATAPGEYKSGPKKKAAVVNSAVSMLAFLGQAPTTFYTELEGEVEQIVDDLKTDGYLGGHKPGDVKSKLAQIEQSIIALQMEQDSIKEEQDKSVLEKRLAKIQEQLEDLKKQGEDNKKREEALKKEESEIKRQITVEKSVSKKS